MFYDRINSKVLAAAFLLLLTLNGCAKPVEVQNLQINGAAQMPAAEAAEYLNSVRWVTDKGPDSFCLFNKRNVDFIHWFDHSQKIFNEYTTLEISSLFAWKGTGRTGLWLRYKNENQVMEFLDIEGCRVLARNASQEEITKAAEALLSLGATYRKP